MPQPYAISSVPPAPAGRCRWFLGATPAGHASHPHETFSLIVGTLTDERLRALGSLTPEARAVDLKYVTVRNERHVLASRGSVSRVPTVDPGFPRPTQIAAKFKSDPARTIESFLLGETGEDGAWESCPDWIVWEAAREVAERESLRGKALRTLNDSLALALLARAGIVVSVGDLPHADGLGG